MGVIPWQDLPRVRLIIDSDVKNEADDQFAIVHALLTPAFDVRGIVPAHFGQDVGETSMARSRCEAELLLDLLGQVGRVRIADGAPHRLVDPSTPIDSPGARLMIQESLAGPLRIAVLGPLTTVASAILLDPGLAGRQTEVIWIGGGPLDGTRPMCWPCFNLAGDRHAANVVFGSGMTVWQIPMPVYTQVWVGYAELARRVAGRGRIGDYLVRQLVDFNLTCDGRAMDGRTLGDSPAIGVAMNPDIALWRDIGPQCFDEGFWEVPAQRGAPILLCERLDVRYLLEDFFAKLELFALD